MVKRLVILLILSGMARFAAAQEPPVISTTIDFLDYVFYDRSGPAEYYPLEQYEKHLREIAESGISKLYLRVNVCGLMLYDSPTSGWYGSRDGDHRSVDAFGPERLENTLHRYDPLTETIRIGKKYGMEVWAWDSLYDDACIGFVITDVAATEKFGQYPLMSKFLRENPGAMALRHPARAFRVSEEEFERRNQEAADRVIGSFVFTSERETGNPMRVNRDNLRIFTSDDNIHYEPYAGDFTFTATADGGRHSFTVGGLAIRKRFVKIATTGMPQDNSFSMVLESPRGVQRVFDTDGREIPSVWGTDGIGWNHNQPEPERRGLDFSVYAISGGAAFDYAWRSIGFGLGEPERIPVGDYATGMAEFCVPATMQYRLDRFRELLKYDFDGYMFNTRTHSIVTDHAEDFGFNPEVRDAYMARYGADIWDENFNDYPRLLELRADAVDDFYAQCRRLTGGRPLYVTTPPAHAFGEKYQRIWYDAWGAFPWHYRKWFENGSVDGVMMIGGTFPEVIKRELPPEGKVKIGQFIEMGLVNAAPPEEFRRQLERLVADPEIDEIELYETLILSQRPELREIVRTVLQSR